MKGRTRDGDCDGGNEGKKQIIGGGKFNRRDFSGQDDSEQAESTSSELDSNCLLLVTSIILLGFMVKYFRG